MDLFEASTITIQPVNKAPVMQCRVCFGQYCEYALLCTGTGLLYHADLIIDFHKSLFAFTTEYRLFYKQKFMIIVIHQADVQSCKKKGTCRSMCDRKILSVAVIAFECLM